MCRKEFKYWHLDGEEDEERKKTQIEIKELRESGDKGR